MLRVEEILRRPPPTPIPVELLMAAAAARCSVRASPHRQGQPCRRDAIRSHEQREHRPCSLCRGASARWASVIDRTLPAAACGNRDSARDRPARLRRLRAARRHPSRHLRHQAAARGACTARARRCPVARARRIRSRQRIGRPVPRARPGSIPRAPAQAAGLARAAFLAAALDGPNAPPPDLVEVLAGVEADRKAVNALPVGPDKEQARKALAARGNESAYRANRSLLLRALYSPAQLRNRWSGSGSITSAYFSRRRSCAGSSATTRSSDQTARARPIPGPRTRDARTPGHAAVSRQRPERRRPRQ